MLLLKAIWLSATLLSAVFFAIFGVSVHSGLRPNLGWVEMVLGSYLLAVVCVGWIWVSVEAMNWVFGG